ncbi:MAG: hypothetical protein J2O47_07105 [Acidimicrobiaceae bacterium]|nr:hypothetical protein [Acidimicrobiaceae bacterium]
MNPETIDNEYTRLEQQAASTKEAIGAFCEKLQVAAEGGDAKAKEWLLDLKTIALQVKEEELQVQSLLQAVHDFTVNHLSEDQSQLHYVNGPAYVPRPAYGYQEGGPGGILSRFMGGGFGRALVTGAGFGIGDDIINRIL